MPIYAFLCDRCGPFDVLRRSADRERPETCPECAAEGRRLFTPPGLVRTSAGMRRARGLEEKSAHEPAVVSKPQGRPFPGGHHHHH